MARGGVRPGGGRPKGARSKRTVETIEMVEASGLTPLEYMLSILRDSAADKADRIDAAKAAAPYVHAKLVASHTTEGKKQTIEEWLALQPPPLMIEDRRSPKDGYWTVSGTVEDHSE